MAASDYTEKKEWLLRDLRTETHGAVSNSMESLGVEYDVNYGLNIYTIKKIALKYPRETGFAKYLYKSDVRELILSSLFLTEPSNIIPEDLPFWLDGIINTEIAENISKEVFSPSAIPSLYFFNLVDSGNQYQIYAAILTLLRRLGDDQLPEMLIRDLILRAQYAKPVFLVRAYGLFIEKYLTLYPQESQWFEELLTANPDAYEKYTGYIPDMP